MSKETIGYDEYMDAGIPDTLLEGLGFYKPEAAEPEMEPETVDMTVENIENENEDENEIHSSPVHEAPPKQPFSRLRSHQMPKIVLKSPPPESSSSPAKQSARASTVVAPSQQVQHIPQPSTFRSRGNSKIVVKGNIMYERTESGEVIASVIKNGTPKPGEANANTSPAVSAVAAVSSMMPLHRGRPPSTVADPRSNATSFSASDPSLTADCPINESNVESVLDRSINATQAMRRTLTNLKDDLRRMGGGPVVTPALRPIHIQHRLDVAIKLANAFVDYRDLIGKISNDKSTPSKSSPAVSVTAGLTPDVNNGKKMMTAASPTPQRAVPRKRGSTTPAASTPTAVAAPLETRVEPQAAKRKPVVPVASTLKRKPAGNDMESVVSDDLWMSCDPCD